jgi:hypothetical protein
MLEKVNNQISLFKFALQVRKNQNFRTNALTKLILYGETITFANINKS